MAEFHVLQAAVPEERNHWLDLWLRSPHREPFAHPAYVELFARDTEHALCACYQEPGATVLYPVIRRFLSNEPWAASETASDLTSPYGYGGPFASDTAVGAAPALWPLFDDWCRENRIISTFTRLALFESQLPALPEQATTLFPNVVRDLTAGPDAIWRDYAHKVRKNVQKARRSELRVEVDSSGARLSEFLEIYESTLDRRSAREDYYFDRTFFERLISRMPESFVFFHVLQGNTVISTELALLSRAHMYSFLGGTLAQHFELRPNDLLKHAAIEWACSRGLQAFVLGGGYGAEDGIYRYKLSFAPTGSLPFRVLRRTHDVATVTHLEQLRRASDPDWLPRVGFFPSYRS